VGKSRILQIATIAWLFLFAAFAFYNLAHAPILCWDSTETDAVTGNIKPVGGCYPEYGQAINNMIFPFVLWVSIFAVLIIFYFKSKK